MKFRPYLSLYEKHTTIRALIKSIPWGGEALDFWLTKKVGASNRVDINHAPFIIIDKYLSFYGEDEITGNEILIEKIRIINRGGSAALNIKVPTIKALGKSARILKELPSIGANEAVECQILNLKQLLVFINSKIPKKKGVPWVVYIPLTVTYNDIASNSLKTDIAIKYSFDGISFQTVNQNKNINWTDLESLDSSE